MFVSEGAGRELIAELDHNERARLLAELAGERSNRRHRPGRGFEALRYRFEIVSWPAPSGACNATGC